MKPHKHAELISEWIKCPSEYKVMRWDEFRPGFIHWVEDEDPTWDESEVYKMQRKPTEWKPKISSVITLLSTIDFDDEYVRNELHKHCKLLSYVLEHAPDWRPDWSDEDQEKWIVYFGVRSGKWTYGNVTLGREATTVHMPQHVAEQLCNDLNSGRVKL